jgi:hypothetical protein
MSILNKSVALVLPLLAGCFVAYDEPPRHYETSSREEATLVVAPEVVEVNYVVYREYFGCSEAEIAYFPHYRRYYDLTDDDIYFIYYTAELSRVSFDVCFHSYYYDCGRNYDRLVVYYHVPRERYFVAIGGDVSPPPMYARTYASYRSGNSAGVTFTNQEYVALVHMKVGVEYQGQAPAAYFSRVQATGSTSRVIVENRDQSGRGGRTAAGTKITATAPRPWTMPPQQKQLWHQDRHESSAKAEAPFKEVHKEQVTRVEKQQPTSSQRPAPLEIEQKPARDNPPPPREPREVERKPAQNAPPPKAQGQGPSDPDSKPAEQRQGEKPPLKHPPHEPAERPKGEDKGDKKDKDEKREK